MFDYDPMAALNAHYLHQIPNFKEYLKAHLGDEPWDVMDAIQNAFDDNEWPETITKIFTLPPFSGDVFEFLTTDEFMEYCALTYGVYWSEEVHYYLQGGNVDWS